MFFLSPARRLRLFANSYLSAGHLVNHYNARSATTLSYKQWTKSDTEHLLKLFAQGWTRPQIAQALDRTPVGVRDHLRKIRKDPLATDKSSCFWSQADDDKLLDLDRSGKTLAEICPNFPDRTAIAVQYRRQLLKLHAPSVRQVHATQGRFAWTDEVEQRLLKLYDQNLSWKAIADEMQVGVATLRGRMRFMRSEKRLVGARSWSEQESEKLFRLKSDGKSYIYP